ncbi:MAG: hypothetical protein IPO88_00540 [Nannocystis sp.]|uniref:double-stranded RNA binding motif domain-containing protein n=1 Tax=Nannocystis sp. TaxID=1962667 RepID=UPI0024255647|nr:double-stranded RNA binding motif domain-containing protein [Nannocystis sp.]MBK9751991.1 hypothetical protein [Nannocystis sp.]
MQLNEMRQLGMIQAYSFELTEQRGPAHMPVFLVRGRAETNDGETVYTETVEASSKKQGEIIAAGPLLAMVIERSA